jgi:diazepam-binding inhibitor (GABA receptor modulator, acyl-CoA-binding protein)
MTENADFAAAQARVRKLSRTPTNEELLELYALYKQATEGAVTSQRPSALNIVARAKYDAWAAHGDMKPDAAQHAYVALVARLVAKYAE